MNKKDIKKTFESLLQYGWMWGRPKHIEDWDLLFKYYKEEEHQIQIEQQHAQYYQYF